MARLQFARSRSRTSSGIPTRRSIPRCTRTPPASRPTGCTPGRRASPANSSSATATTTCSGIARIPKFRRWYRRDGTHAAGQPGILCLQESQPYARRHLQHGLDAQPAHHHGRRGRAVPLQQRLSDGGRRMASNLFRASSISRFDQPSELYVAIDRSLIDADSRAARFQPQLRLCADATSSRRTASG